MGVAGNTADGQRFGANLCANQLLNGRENGRLVTIKRWSRIKERSRHLSGLNGAK